MIRYRRIGGIHFLRVWRFRVSFCIARPGRRRWYAAGPVVNATELV